jgi:hypothetical protein
MAAKDRETPILHTPLKAIPSDRHGMVDWEKLNKAIIIEQGKTFPSKSINNVKFIK